MGILDTIIGGGVVTAAEGVANIIDQFVETDDEKRAAKIIKAKMMMKPSLAQVEINKVEAGHRSIFVAGWRPFVGWVCGFALAYNFIVRDLIAWVIVNTDADASLPPDLAMGELMTVLLGMLGLGAFRTVEKFGGKAR